MFASFKPQLLPYALVVFFGYVGFSLPLPVLPEMFLDKDSPLLPLTYSLSHKTLLLGTLMCSYPLGQLFGAPLFGQLSDRYGRKRTILLTLMGTATGYVVTALSTSMHHFMGIFIGLLTCGFFEGNVAIAQSVIADITEHDNEGERASHFGWINLFVCLGFLIGPLLGGQLSDSKVSSSFSYATPFWVAAGMTLMGALSILIWSKETRLSKPIVQENAFRSLGKAFKMPRLRVLYIANFFLALGFFSYFRFLPVYLKLLFDFSSSLLAYVMVYGSLMFALALLLLNKSVSRHFTPIKATALFSLILGGMFVALVIPSSPMALLITIPLIGAALSIAMTNASVMISQAASRDFQGQAMGSLTSIQVLAELLTAIGGGIFAATYPSLPLLIGALMAGICSLVLVAFSEKQQVFK